MKLIKKKISISIMLALGIVFSLSGCGQKDDEQTKKTTSPESHNKNGAAAHSPDAMQSSYSPYVGRDHPENVYFGDTHLHTSISLDAYGDGNTKVGPDEAYRWAKGETIASDNGIPARISRPLDFLMVADHAEYLGLVPGLGRKDPLLMKDKEGARWAKMIEEGKLKSDVFSEFIHDWTIRIGYSIKLMILPFSIVSLRLQWFKSRFMLTARQSSWSTFQKETSDLTAQIPVFTI